MVINMEEVKLLLCRAQAPGMKPPALRVRIIVFYVSRPSGKYRHKVKFYHLRWGGSKTGLVNRRPFFNLLHGRAGLCLLFLLSLRGVLYSEGMIELSAKSSWC